MRLGTYWFVRIGIVMVLTAMVFLGNYAYQHYVGLLGPLGKVILLYLTSAGLLAAGALLHRKEEKFRNYSQVLFAGGLAAVYFTTYAAHHFPNLRVIHSVLIDGVLLLGWLSYIVWLADKKKSELLALFAIGLAYYTALITNVGNFTLISNLLLATAAVYFLIRNRWVALSFVSIAASYGSYFYWRYYAGSTGIEEFAGRLSLCGYWTIFTAAVFLSRHAEFQGPRRSGFLSFNNAAAFMLLTYSFLHQHSGKFWQLSLAAGALLLALSYVALKFIPEDEMPRRAYLAQGILLITLGIITKLSGPTLALVLAVESALLLIFSTQWKSNFVRAGSVIVAALSAGWLISTIKTTDTAAWAEGAGVAALLLFNAFWSGKHELEVKQLTLRPLTAYFAGLSLFTWFFATITLAAPLQIAPILAMTTVALTALHYLLRVPEVTLLGQAPLAMAQGQLLILLADKQLGPTWTPPIVILISLAMALWWRHQKVLDVESTAKRLLEILFAGAAAGITQLYLPQAIHGEAVITASWILTVAWTALGLFARSWPITAAGQLFLVAAFFSRMGNFLNGGVATATAGHTIELIVALLFFAALAHIFSKRLPEIKPVEIASHVYQWLATALIFLLVRRDVTYEYRFILLVLLFAPVLIATAYRARYTFIPGLTLAITGVLFWTTATFHQPQDLAAIVILGAIQTLLRKKPSIYPITNAAHNASIAAISALLWMFVSRWVVAHSGGAHFYLTASWAGVAFALFGIGFLLRELAYRWTALTILACALARVMMLDVWRLETIYRILSFFALGIVLLALGYLYTRQSIKSNPPNS